MDHVTLYHGTSSANVESIKREGLKPGHGLGADAWASMKGWHVAKESAKRTPSVYASTSKINAENFAGVAAIVNPGKATLVELKIPKSQFEKHFVPDERSDKYSRPENFRYEGVIPPTWVAEAIDVSDDPETTFFTDPKAMLLNDLMRRLIA